MSELRRLPKVDVLASSLSDFPEPIRVRAARRAIEQLRAKVLQGGTLEDGDAAALAQELASREARSSLQPVVNASGVVLHTGIGRARLAPEAARALAGVSDSHALVEFDLESGQRGDRQDHVRDLLTELTGAADALVVNNCAAAVFLTLNALCAGRGVVLSRGQMVEIGGAFRMPDIVRQSGCRLIEVGCTNKTHLRDYAVPDEDVAAILRCHPSNFRMVGFVEEPSPAELAQRAHERGWIMIDDVGSGTLHDTTDWGLPKEATLQEAIRAGADVVLSSADKMLGGPQAGLILGSKEAISAIRKHPLARAVRVDKLTLAALEATLRLHAQNRLDEIPTLWALRRPLEAVKRDAQTLKRAWAGDALLELDLTEVGGGSAPGVGVFTWRVGLASSSADALAKRFRLSTPAVVGRIEKERFWLDPRTMDPAEVRAVATLMRSMRPV